MPGKEFPYNVMDARNDGELLAALDWEHFRTRFSMSREIAQQQFEDLGGVATGYTLGQAALERADELLPPPPSQRGIQDLPNL